MRTGLRCCTVMRHQHDIYLFKLILEVSVKFEPHCILPQRRITCTYPPEVSEKAIYRMDDFDSMHCAIRPPRSNPVIHIESRPTERCQRNQIWQQSFTWPLPAQLVKTT